MDSFEPFDSVEHVEQLSSVVDPAQLVRDSHNPRLQRVFAYQADALAKPHGLESNLASINCGLMRMALRLEEMIENSIDQVPLSGERLQLMYKAIDTHLRVARQIDRFAQVELRRVATAGSKPKKRVDIECWIDDAAEPGVPKSEDSNI